MVGTYEAIPVERLCNAVLNGTPATVIHERLAALQRSSTMPLIARRVQPEAWILRHLPNDVAPSNSTARRLPTRSANVDTSNWTKYFDFTTRPPLRVAPPSGLIPMAAGFLRTCCLLRVLRSSPVQYFPQDPACNDTWRQIKLTFKFHDKPKHNPRTEDDSLEIYRTEAYANLM